MKIDEYIDLVCKEIKNRRIRSSINRELYSHLTELKEDYIDQGMEPLEAELKSVRDMGDPQSTGQRLNEIHKHKPEWRLLITSIAIIVLGIIVQYIAFPNRAAYTTITNGLASILVFVFFYYVDYTFLLKYKSEAFVGAILLIALPFIFKLFEYSIWFALIIIFPILSLLKNPDENNEKSNYTDPVHREHSKENTSKSIFDGMESGWTRLILLNFPQSYGLRGLFAVILLASVLIRVVGFSSVQNAYLYMLAFIVFLVTIQFKNDNKIKPIILYYGFVLSYGMFFDEKGMLTPVCLIMAATLMYMLHRNWISLKKRIGLPLIWAPFIYFMFFTIKDYLMNPTSLGNWTNKAYGLNIKGEHITSILQGSKFIGKGSFDINFNFQAMEHFIITYIIGNYGLLAGIIVIELLLLLVIFLVVNTYKSKHEFGKVISFACSATICVEVITYILSNLGFFSFPPGFLPFFTGNYVATTLNAACLGLILSIRSNRNIIDEEKIFLRTRKYN
ncbi:permease prefix domain 1-containing protein [Proteiniborus sp.]|uniref:permease prefix domain 1-containing protein n=1 Tax=Proteiniborus sp. TaxID=2079015 RepID=UPI00332BE309